MDLQRQSDLLAAHLVRADRDAAWLAKVAGIKYRVLLRYIRGERPLPLTCGSGRSEPVRSALWLVATALHLTEAQTLELALAAGLDVPGLCPAKAAA
jgi:hypothetical protein